jgi:hypothetical protein
VRLRNGEAPCGGFSVDESAEPVSAFDHLQDYVGAEYVFKVMRPMINSQSSHSARTAQTKRSAIIRE